MATLTICDGCGEMIKPWDVRDPTASDGLSRLLRISTGNIHQTWDLCDPCQKRVAHAIAETLPYKPRETWLRAIRPKDV